MDAREYESKLERIAARLDRKRGGGFERLGEEAGIKGAMREGAPKVEGARNRAAVFEAVIRWYRPALVVEQDAFQMVPVSDDDPNPAASIALMAALEAQNRIIGPSIRSVGRIELKGNARFPWVGTGWIIDDDVLSDIVVTNAHVAREFAHHTSDGWVFRPGIPNHNQPQAAWIDFREELGSAPAREFRVTEVIWISEDSLLDMALLRVEREAGVDRIDSPVKLIDAALDPSAMLAVVGYPGSSDGYDPVPFERLFGKRMGKKRFSPGFSMGVNDGSLNYDCSTLPGSSGSLVLDVTSGRAAGLHFAGTAFDTNFAMPAAEIRRVLRERPWSAESVRSAAVPTTGPALSTTASGSITTTIPLHVTIHLGDTPSVGVDAGSGAVAAPASTRESARVVAASIRERLRQNRDVLSVHPGNMFRQGLMTREVGVVVAVAPGASLDPKNYGLATRTGGVEVSVETADPQTIAEEKLGVRPEAFGGRVAKYERDLDDERFDLSPITEQTTLTLHVSPEGGWPVLRDFLAHTDCSHLTIGMYHMTAPHVVDAIEGIAKRRNSNIVLTLDRQRGDAEKPDDTDGPTKAKDIPESDTLDSLEQLAGKRFKWAPASLGASGLFATAYHIKVAVWSNGDKAERFWLSSGNWQSSNQPRIDRKVDEIGAVTEEEAEGYNREWHAVVEGQRLAQVFQNHLRQDYEDNEAMPVSEAPPTEEIHVLVPEAMLEARRGQRFRAFPPEVITGRVKVQPLLTPDNYPEVVASLISRARERVLIENQSFNFWKELDDTPEHFLAIARAVKAKQNAGLDVRIIFRSGFGKERDTLRRMADFGLKAGPEHVRYFDTCHTKGIVIDRKIAVLGSHNWTGGGVGPNRDASLVIWHEKANEYFAKTFEHDWANVAETRVREMPRMEAIRWVAAGKEAQVPHGYRRISLAEFLGET